jgi:hypothetical protein
VTATKGTHNVGMAVMVADRGRYFSIIVLGMAKSTATGSEPPPEAARDALYAAPLPEFLDLRARLAAELRTEGKKALAKAVLALRKPNAVAWGLNQLARRHPELLTRLREVRAHAEKAQGGGDSGKMRAAIAEYRAELDRLVGLVEAGLIEAGSSPTKEHLRNVRETLEAAALDPKGLGAELARGCLVRSLENDDSEASEAVWIAAPPPKRERDQRAPSPALHELTRPKEKVVDLAAERAKAAARKALDEAIASLREAESSEATAREHLKDAERRLTDGVREVREARARVEAATRAALRLDPTLARPR